MQTDYDITIAGGGMVGAGLACALAGSRYRVAVIEAVAPDDAIQPSYDDRGLSLSLASQRILSALGVWPALSAEATPIEHIHVSDRGRFGFVRLHAADLNLPAMGYVVVARQLGRALLARLHSADNIDFLCPARVDTVRVSAEAATLRLAGDGRELTGRLLVVADGARSGLRDRLGFVIDEKDYGQTAIVANVTPERGHENRAFERFTDSGPVALLPLSGNRCASVFTVPREAADDYMALPDADYLERLQQRFGRRLGRLVQVGRRKSYPVVKLVPDTPLGDRALLLGNAAHTIHPNGAQGFNLGLRDAAALAEVLLQSPAADAGAPAPLQEYLARRRADQQRVIRFTDRLAEWFYNDDPLRIVVRDTGMLLTDLVPAFKRAFMRRAMGVAGRQPAMVRTGEPHGH